MIKKLMVSFTACILLLCGCSSTTNENTAMQQPVSEEINTKYTEYIYKFNDNWGISSKSLWVNVPDVTCTLLGIETLPDAIFQKDLGSIYLYEEKQKGMKWLDQVFDLQYDRVQTDDITTFTLNGEPLPFSYTVSHGYVIVASPIHDYSYEVSCGEVIDDTFDSSAFILDFLDSCIDFVPDTNSEYVELSLYETELSDLVFNDYAEQVFTDYIDSQVIAYAYVLLPDGNPACLLQYEDNVVLVNRVACYTNFTWLPEDNQLTLDGYADIIDVTLKANPLYNQI